MNEYRLVVCEKPSVARSIAAVLGAGRRGDGFLSGGGYLVSWCFGHLAELSDADAYDEKFGKWRREDLPILPDSWQYTVARDKQKQMNTLRTLMHREDVCEVVNACDAGREGELIFRTAYNLNNCRKRVKRLWISSMEDAAILQGFDNLRDGAEYDNLYASALCRSKADWLVGINATRLFSVMYHRTLNVGRVVSPTLALLVQREAEINAFQPETFYTVHLDFDGFSAAGGRMKEQAEAERLAGDCNSKAAAVTSVVQTKKTEKAPALYDLTALQRDANRLLGYTAQQTLDYLQSLYEKKLCTYPRTDSRYLTDDMESGVNALALCCAGICGTEPPAAVCSGQVCSSKKVSDHHAVVPTMAAGETDLEALPAGEREILRLVSRQVLMAVSAPFVYLETEARLDCGGNGFSAKGKTVVQPGWKAYADAELTDKPLPELSEGQSLPVSSCAVKEGKTTPPKHFTEDTLLSAMETAGKEDMPETAERRGLGTPAKGRLSLKSWWPRALRSAKRRRNLYASFPPKRAYPSLPCCPNSSSPRCSPPNGSTASRRSSAASWARTSSLSASAIWSQRWYGTLRRWTARRCCSPPADPLWANAPAAARRSRRAKTAISARDGAASSGCGGTTASLPPRRSA